MFRRRTAVDAWPPFLPAVLSGFVLAAFCIELPPVLPAELPNELPILTNGGADAEKIIRKARSILYATRVFATPRVSYFATPTSSCWALTVIVRYDSGAKDFLGRLFTDADCTEAKLYAVVGLMVLEPQRQDEILVSAMEALGDRQVECLDGCSSSTSRGAEVLARLRRYGGQRYLFKNLPSLYETTDPLRWGFPLSPSPKPPR